MKTIKWGAWLAAALSLALAVTTAMAQAPAAKTLQVNVGESVIVPVNKVAKLAVADPNVADVAALSEKEISVIGKKVGITTLTVVHEDGDKTEPTKVYRVEVGNDTVIGAIRNAISAGAVSVRVIGETLVLEGQVETELEAQRAEQIAKAFKPQVANMIEIKNPRQVKIKIRVAEVRRDKIRQIGLKHLNDNGEVLYGFNMTGMDNVIDPILHGFLIDPQSRFADTGVNVALQLLEQEGWGRMLAEPTLLTRSGVEASFLAGQEVPIVQQLQNTFSVEYKEVGVRVKIKPVADSQGRINTTIHAEVSEVSGRNVAGGAGVQVPIIATRKADTTLQVADGQTIVLAGLLNNTIDPETLRKFPWLADIPIIGALFRHRDKQQSQRELLFFMTPTIVRDVQADTQKAPQTPMMKDWNAAGTKGVLEMPNAKDDWGLHDPQNWGIPEQKPATPDAGPDKAKEPAKNYTPARPAAR